MLFCPSLWPRCAIRGLLQACFHLLSDKPEQEGSCAHLFHRIETIPSHIVENLVDKAVAIPRDLGYTENITTTHIGTKRHASSGNRRASLLISPHVRLFLTVTIIVFMHLNRRGRYRHGYRCERGARVKTQPAAEAVEHLIRAYGRLVFHVIHGMIHHWQESEDLTQEVFLSAFRGVDAAQTARGAQFQAKAWLLHITINTVRMYRRRQRLMHFVPFSHLETAEAGADVISELAATVQLYPRRRSPASWVWGRQPSASGSREPGGSSVTSTLLRVVTFWSMFPLRWRLPVGREGCPHLSEGYH